VREGVREKEKKKRPFFHTPYGVKRASPVSLPPLQRGKKSVFGRAPGGGKKEEKRPRSLWRAGGVRVAIRLVA